MPSYYLIKNGQNTKEKQNLALKYLNNTISLDSTATLNMKILYYLNKKEAIKHFNETIKHKYVYVYNNINIFITYFLYNFHNNYIIFSQKK